MLHDVGHFGINVNTTLHHFVFGGLSLLRPPSLNQQFGLPAKDHLVVCQFCPSSILVAPAGLC
jgi:hypothetical protein